MTIVRAAITQTTWTGDKESMLDKHEQFARDAKEQGAQVICFQELFYGPYFGITEDVKYYDYAEPADGPIVQRFAALAKELGMVMVLPIYEEEQPGVYYNTAVVVDADGTILGKYRKHHIPQPRQVLGEVLLPPRQPRLPGVRHGRRPDRRLHLLRPALPRGLARARPERRADRLQPERHEARPLEPPLGDRAAGRRRRERLLRRRRQPRRPRGQRVRRPRRRTSTARARSSTRTATSSASYGSETDEEVVVRDLDMDMVRDVRNAWQFYRDRRPDSYTSIPKP